MKSHFFPILLSLTLATSALAQTYKYAYAGGTITSSDVGSSQIVVGDLFLVSMQIDMDILDTSSSIAGGIFTNAASVEIQMLGGFSTGIYEGGSAVSMDFQTISPDLVELPGLTSDFSGFNTISGDSMTDFYFSIQSTDTSISYTNNTGNALGDVWTNFDNFTGTNFFVMEFGGSDYVQGDTTYFGVFDTQQFSSVLSPTIAASAVPEPGTYAAFLSVACLGVVGFKRRNLRTGVGKA